MLSFYWITYIITTPVPESIKALHEEGNYDTYTHRPHTMGSKELKPWSPRWVRQKLREKNNGLSQNDPNHEEKPPTDAKRHACKCDFNCQSHMSLDHDMYGRRYWSCPLPTCLFHWGWDEEKPRKVVSVLTFTFHILNIVVINRFIFLKGVRVTLFPPPPKPPGCDFKQWIDDYMTLKDIEYAMWVKKNKAAMRKGASSSK
jgi:hypothetical protein